MTTATRIDRYPSRAAATASLTPRHDPVVHGDLPGPLDPDLLASYEEDGFLSLPGLLAPSETEALNADIDRLAADPAVRAAREAILEPDGRALRSLFAVHNDDGLLGRLARDPRLVAIARQLMGGDVTLHQTRVNLKPALRGRGFSWHSDFETWHTEDGMADMRAVSCSVSLTPNHAWNGPLMVIAGSHQTYVSCVGETPENHFEDSLRAQHYGTPDDDSLMALADGGRIEQCLGPAGTVVFFDCNLMHGSTDNLSPVARRNAFFVYRSIDNPLQEPFAAPAPRPEFIASRSQIAL